MKVHMNKMKGNGMNIFKALFSLIAWGVTQNESVSIFFLTCAMIVTIALPAVAFAIAGLWYLGDITHPVVPVVTGLSIGLLILWEARKRLGE